MPTPFAIDASHWNVITDWTALATAGIVGVIHKTTESVGYTDPTYAPRRQQATAAGLLWGAYHFLRPGDIVGQANYFLAKAKPDAHTLLAADHEDSAVSLDDLKLFLRTISDAVEQSPVVYSGYLIKQQLSGADAELASYRLWLAHYGRPVWPTATWPSWWLWQFTDQGSVGGIAPVDVNAYRYDAKRLRAEWSGTS